MLWSVEGVVRHRIMWYKCNDRGLGPGLEAGPRLDKRGSPRGLV